MPDFDTSTLQESDQPSRKYKTRSRAGCIDPRAVENHDPPPGPRAQYPLPDGIIGGHNSLGCRDLRPPTRPTDPTFRKAGPLFLGGERGAASLTMIGSSHQGRPGRL